MKLFCCACKQEVEARLTSGREIYPSRYDLASLPFWRCDTCKNYVGCHHKTRDSIKPLGVIPSKEIRNARRHIHNILDPLWKAGQFKRVVIYKMVSKKLGYTFHTADIRDIEEARKIYTIIKEIAKR